MLAIYCTIVLAVLAVITYQSGPQVVLWLLAVAAAVAIYGELERRHDER